MQIDLDMLFGLEQSETPRCEAPLILPPHLFIYLVTWMVSVSSCQTNEEAWGRA